MNPARSILMIMFLIAGFGTIALAAGAADTPGGLSPVLSKATATDSTVDAISVAYIYEAKPSGYVVRKTASAANGWTVRNVDKDSALTLKVAATSTKTGYLMAGTIAVAPAESWGEGVLTVPGKTTWLTTHHPFWFSTGMNSIFVTLYSNGNKLNRVINIKVI